jgi:hypothetical protein
MRDARSLHGHTPVSFGEPLPEIGKMPSHDKELLFASEAFRRRMSFHLLHCIGVAKCLRSTGRVYVLFSSKAMDSLKIFMDADAACLGSSHRKCGRLVIP